MSSVQPVTPRVRRGSRIPESPAVSIIVLVTSDTDRLQRCLASITGAAEGGPVAEVLVLANGTPASALTSLATREDIVLIRSAVNHGFGGGCNWAAGFARGERLVFVNDDAVVTAGWLAALDQAVSGDPGAGVVGSRILLRDGRLQEAGNVIWRDGSTSHLGRTLPAGEPRLLARRDVDYVSFCSAMIRRETWEQVGGFDERYFPAYYEDADLCLAVRQLGWSVLCEPTSVVIHEEGGSTPVRFRHFLSNRNQRLFVSKWGAVLGDFPDRPAKATPNTVLEAAMRRAQTGQARSGSPSSTLDRVRRPARPGKRRSRRRNAHEVAEADVLALEVRHLADDVAVKDEYAAFLASELEGFGPAALLRAKYAALRQALGRQVRRHPRLARPLDRLRARIRERR
jgi:GT2 family glycosyltransferase